VQQEDLERGIKRQQAKLFKAQIERGLNLIGTKPKSNQKEIEV